MPTTEVLIIMDLVQKQLLLEHGIIVQLCPIMPLCEQLRFLMSVHKTYNPAQRTDIIKDAWLSEAQEVEAAVESIQFDDEDDEIELPELDFDSEIPDLPELTIGVFDL